MMRGLILVMVLGSTAVLAQGLDATAVQKDLATGDALKIMAWACVIEGAVIVVLFGLILKLAMAFSAYKDTVHAETVEQLTGVVGLAQKQNDGIGVLDRAIDVFTRRP